MFKPDSTFHVMYISNVEATKTFYEALGAEIVKVEDDKVVVNLGAYNLHFILDSTEPWEEYKFAAGVAGRGQGILFYIEVEDLEEAYRKVKELQANVRSQIKENWWDGKEFLFEDPDGYKFVFYKMN